MIRHDLSVTLPWAQAGSRRLLAVVDGLTDADLSAPSLLPGWTRAHVVGHVARNAEALGRLAEWARSGVETPMYRDREQRAAEIEASAALPPAVLRHDLVATAARLDRALVALDDSAWRAPVRSALGRIIPAAEIPWLRAREVWLHAVDLAAGSTTADLPDLMADTLLDEVTQTLSAQPECPSIILDPVDRDRRLRLGPATDQPDTATATASAAQLLAWLTGRDPELGPALLGRPVALPRWL